MIGPAGVTIRSGRAEEMAALAAIADEGASTRPEAEAGVPLDPTGRLLPARLAACRAEDLLWTAADGADRPVGVLVATIADDALHVVTLAIVRAHRRRGVGRALLERAIGHGRWAFFPAVTVTAGVEAPFYRRSASWRCGRIACRRTWPHSFAPSATPMVLGSSGSPWRKCSDPARPQPLPWERRGRVALAPALHAAPGPLYGPGLRERAQ